MDVRHAMTDYFASAHVNSSVEDVIEKMLGEGLSKLFIVDDSSQLVGSMDESMLINGIFDEAWRNSPARLQMNTDCETVSLDTDVKMVLEKFRESGLAEFPVIEQGKLIGVLTRRQLMRAILNRSPAKNRRFSLNAEFQNRDTQYDVAVSGK